jgi:replication fork clamp-binding protein CrfC
MEKNNEHIDAVLQYIKQYRSDEANFEKLYAKLEEELSQKGAEASYTDSLHELKEKQAIIYRQAKKEGTSAWPEFEKFVSGFEKTVTGALNK